jgi:hypothetical protein
LFIRRELENSEQAFHFIATCVLDCVSC